MKINYLWISKYKNINNIELFFNSNHTFLVGKNGLGKSNLIEILALIFRDLDLLEKEEDFKNWSYNPDHFEYVIIYECQNSELKIECKNDYFDVQRRQRGTKNIYKKIPFSNFKKSKSYQFLPSHIIGYYSGENKRIKDIIRPYEEIGWRDLKFNKGMDNDLRRILFAENHHSQLILLTILLFKSQTNNKKFLKFTDHLIKDFLSFSELDSIEIKLQNPLWYKRTINEPGEKGIEFIESNLLSQTPVEFPFWNAKGKANRIIFFFYNNDNESPKYYYDEKDNKEYLELTLDKTKIASKIYNTFANPLKFLDSLESLHIINSINEIVLNVRSKDKTTTFSFNALSEGEQQLITVLGLLLINFRNDCLFLLDEPDTHLNPTWQRDYIKLLKQFNLNSRNSHLIVATHSPLLVQAADNDTDIFLFKQNKKNIEVICHDFKEKNWRIDHVLTSEYFELKSSRPESIDSFMDKREKLLSKKKLSKEDIKMINNWEENFELLPTGETITDLRVLKRAYKYFSKNK